MLLDAGANCKSKPPGRARRGVGQTCDGAHCRRNGRHHASRVHGPINPVGSSLAELSGLPAAGIDPQGRLTFVYLRRGGAPTFGLTYSVEFSDLNAPFAPNPAATTAAFGIDANWERVTVTDSVTSGGVRTARIRVRTSP